MMNKRFFSTGLLLLLGFLMLQQKTHAQFEEGVSETPNAHISGTSIATNATNTLTYTSSANELSHKIKNVISLKINEYSNVFPLSGFTATVNLTIETWVTAAGSSNTQTQSLTVSYDPAAGAKYNARATIALDNYEKVKITVNSISISGNSGSWEPKSLLDLVNEMRITRYYQLAADATTLAISFDDPVDQTDALEVFWYWNAAAYNNMSQLEWAWVEDDMAGFYTQNNVLNTDNLFLTNSTRVDIDYGQHSFKIPLLYPDSGKLYYRARAVQRKNNGQLITGPWSAVQEYDFAGHEPNLNWQSSTSFAENGKSKTIIQYFDGSLRNRQIVTKDNETGNTIVGETIYDLQGRANVQILPTPTMATAIQYFTNFNRFQGQLYNVQNPAYLFDLTTAGVQCSGAPPLDSSSGNSRYYSVSNDLIDYLTVENKANFIPKASGYAYTETRYTDDATERISVQGGVGPNHQIGSGHETKYYYGKPNQQELDALFGTEVGDASHYSKNMVQDANGQMSVSYVDMHGRTIATALAGESPGNLNSIVNSTDYPQATGALTNQLLAPATNLIKDNRIESVSTILAPASTVYNFNYQLNPAIFSKFGDAIHQQVCFDCKYDLEISIRPEDCSAAAPIVKKYSNLQIVAASDACATPMGFIGEGITTPTNQISFSQTLTTGSWVVRKTLTVNDSMFAIRKDSALKVFLLTTQQHIYDSVFAAQSALSGCNLPAGNTSACDSCNAHLGTYTVYKTNYLNAIGNPTGYDTSTIHAQYSKDSLACADACGHSSQLSTLAGLRSQMLADMMPFTGQYAIDPLFNTSGNPTAFAASSEQAKYNIFTSSPSVSGKTKPFYINPHTEGSATSFYYTADNIVDPALYDGSNNYLLPNMTVADFANRFQPSWANSLIYYHPEFSNLKYAEANLVSSYAWLDKVQLTETYAQAQTAGYLDPVNSDPYFVNSYDGNDKININRYISSYVPGGSNSSGSNPSIWQIANSSVLCAGASDATKNSCMMNTSKTGLDAAITNTADKDKAWEQFKSVYFSYRNEMLVKYINTQSGTLSASAISNLQADGKQLVFATMQQQADQNGAGSWWSKAAGVSSASDTVGLGALVNTYVSNNNLNGDKCIAQKPFWAAKLYQCEPLKALLNNETHADTVAVNNIINSILDGMVSVCHNSQTAMQPYGASTVNPAIGGSPASFEAIINQVLHANGISTSDVPANYFCNPFSVDAPKPFGKNAPLFVNYTNKIDSCGCSRFATLKQEAISLGFSPYTMSGMNQFLVANYHDTLTISIWNGLQNCSSMFNDTCLLTLANREYLQGRGPSNSAINATGETSLATNSSPCVVYTPIQLPAMVAMPAFLNCDYQKPCMSCTQLNALTTEFISLYPSYNGVPYTIETATDAQTQQNNLWARFLNYRTGFSIGVKDYIAATQNCGTGGGGTSYSVIGNGMDCGPGTSVDTLLVYSRLSPYYNQYLARKSVVFLDGFESVNADEFETGIDSSYGNCNPSGIAGNTGVPISGGGNNNSVAWCAFDKPLNDISRLEPTDTIPCRQAQTQSQFIAQLLFSRLKDSLTANFDSLYQAKCLSVQSTEQFYATYQPKEYHYTLYYYDQAGNLVKTLPPAAVMPNYSASYLASVVTQRNAAADLATSNNEALATEYRYNTLNQVVVQQTPDAGISKFWYDRLGRLAISQNAKQATTNQYSYTLHDVLGRITEVGQRPQSTAMTQTISQDATALQSWLNNNASGGKGQITSTLYDLPFTALSVVDVNGKTVLIQQNLRNRVSYSMVFDNESQRQYLADGTFNGGNSATFYSYDIHGNVDTLLQDYGNSSDVSNVMNSTGNRFKKMVYNYDLISGKVNSVAYQPGQPDQFYHLYQYDAENRLTTVKTSKDSLYWEQEAAYIYYRHGPLARTVLGQNYVQGIDYAYTLQGWLKTVNSNSIGDGIHDMGRDGMFITQGGNTYSGENNLVARDAYGYMLNYYTGDYIPANNVNVFASLPSSLPSSTTGVSLFNGNINSMLVGMPALSNHVPYLYGYRYDQLNRLNAMDAFTITETDGNPVIDPTRTIALTATNDYKERISYDPNGKILTFGRWGKNRQLDDATYHYTTNTNKLNYVSDPTGKITDDVANQSANNYQWNEIGEMIHDADRGLSNATWTIYGKIQTQSLSNGSTINYTYDLAGNRISKTVSGTSGYTEYYVRDASGNVISIYKAGNNDVNSGHLTQSEINLYGSSRLGTYKPNTDVTIAPNNTVTLTDGAVGYLYTLTRGNKFFELTDHRGNNLATISDRKTPVDQNTDGYIDYYNADVIAAQDYSSFGAMLDGRQTGNTPRYTYNGKQLDKELGWQDYGMREYLGGSVPIFASVDPLTHDYPWYTPYQFAGNMPIKFIDLDGAEPAVKGTTEGQKIPTKQIIGTGPGGYGESITDWYWHNGGLSTGAIGSDAASVTQPGWLNEADYKKTLTTGPNGGLAGQAAGALGLFSSFIAGHNWSEEEKQKSGNNAVTIFLNSATNEGAGLLVSAANDYAHNRNFTVTGTTTPSSFNVEDMVGLGIALKQIGKAFFSSITAKSFYSVQGLSDIARLKGGGLPWPTAPTAAHLGEGLYVWGSKAEASSYLKSFSNRDFYNQLSIVQVQIHKSDFKSLRSFIIPENEIGDNFLGKYSRLYGEGQSHNYQYIRGNTGFGHEHYFSQDIFHLFKIK